MQLRFFLAIALIYIINFNEAFSVYRSNQFGIFGSVGANLNLYNSSFGQLPGIPNSSTEFKSAFGLGENFALGGNYNFKSPFLGINYRYNFQFSYSNLSANYIEREQIGFLVRPNGYEEIFVDYELKPSIALVSLEHYLDFMPSRKLPFSMKVGFQVGLPIVADFYQAEVASSPSDFTFENGLRTRNEYDEKIPDISAVLFSVAVGLETNIWSNRELDLNLETIYFHGLNNVIPNVDWRINRGQATLKLTYNFLPEPVPPIAPPMPRTLPMPADPPKPKFINLATRIYNQEKELSTNDTIKIMLNLDKYEERYKFLPILYYSANSDELVPYKQGGSEVERNAQIQVLNAVADYLIDNPKVNVSVNVFGVSSEENEIVNSRGNKIISTLEEKGINPKRISLKRNIKNDDDFKYPQLLEEHRRIEFTFSNYNTLVPYHYKTREKITSDASKIRIVSDIETNADERSVFGEIVYDEGLVKEFDSEEYTYDINIDNIPRLGEATTSVMKVLIRARTNTGVAVNNRSSFYISPIIVSAKQYTNVIENDGVNHTEQYILGYTDFDKSQIHSVDKTTIDIIKEAVAQGKRVQILALTDNLGSEEYNKNLANQRANAAMNLLPNNLKDKVEMLTPKEEVFSNDHPYGRTLNRAIIVRIK